MLKMLPESTESHWKDNLCIMMHACNCTRHASTGYLPFYLLFSRSPRLPVDVMFKFFSASRFPKRPAVVSSVRTGMETSNVRSV